MPFRLCKTLSPLVKSLSPHLKYPSPSFKSPLRFINILLLLLNIPFCSLNIASFLPKISSYFLGISSYIPIFLSFISSIPTLLFSIHKSSPITAIFFLITLLFLLAVLSCKNEKNTQNNAAKTEIPLALQDKKSDITSYKRYNDLTEELYKELVDKSAELQKLEEDIIAINPKIEEQTSIYATYDNKSKAYYNATEYYGISNTKRL